MRRRGLRTLLTGVVTIAVAAGSPAVPGWAAPTGPGAVAPSAAAPAAERTAAPATFTLITGDRVTVRAGGSASVEAGPGRAGMRFLTQTSKGHRYVIPADALPLLQSGRVDRRLFDVTTLGEFGYDDRAVELPLLVSYSTAGNRGAAAARSASTVRGARVVRELPVVGALAVHADRAGRAGLWGSLTAGTSARRLTAGVDTIWLDGKRKISLDVSVPQIGAPEAWKAGLDGTGVTVAVLDTGIDATHPDLAGQIKGSQNFTTAPDTDDTVGHGTHVASTIAGTGAASAGRYRGVAPGAKLLIGKVCETDYCEDSAILAGMAWAAPQAQVINMSLGGQDTIAQDPLEKAVEDLTSRYGTLFVVAAGNWGEDASVSSPASTDAALAVGAVDRENQLAEFSSRGPRVGDDAVKPDITAPGVDIVAAKAAHGFIGDPAPVDRYTTLSGTSMATPHVAGAAAIVAQQHPAWSAQQRKSALMGSAKPTDGVGVFGQGAGRVDVARVITQTVTAEGGSVSFGRQQWPHGDDVPVTRTVAYRNSGTAPVTLTLTVHASRPDGSPAPEGVFAVSTRTLTVPAGGRAEATLTADTRVAGPDGYYSGYLTAVATGGVQVQTPFAVNREVESYDVTLVHTNRDGTPAEEFLTVLTNLDTFTSYEATGPEARATLRLPKGDYGFFSWISGGYRTEDPADDQITMLVQPRIAVTGPATIRLDARQGRPVRVTVPKRDATPTLIAASADWTAEQNGTSASALVDRFDQLYTAQMGPNRAVANFTGTMNASFARRTGESFRNSPYMYDLAWFAKGRFFTGFVKAVKASQLATIKAAYASEATGTEGVKFNAGRLTEESSYWAVLIPFDLPFRRTEYVNTDGGVRWSSEFNQQIPPVGDEWPEAVSGSFADLTRYRGGRTYRQEWNRAVFGPSVAHATAEFPWAARTGDVIAAGVPLFAEGTGRIGWSLTDKARTALYAGSKLVGESEELWGEFTVPAAAASYRLEASAERGAPHTLSTRVSATWTFRSRHVSGKTTQPLPLSTVRFSPKLDERNAAPAGARYAVPLTVERQAGSGAGRVRSLTVDVSYDDGRTWQRAQVRGSGQSRVATVRHPQTAGFASLRVRAADTAGNTVTQTIVRAYRIG